MKYLSIDFRCYLLSSVQNPKLEQPKKRNALSTILLDPFDYCTIERKKQAC